MKNKYDVFDLGHGLHVSLDPYHFDALIPNVFVTQTSLGKILPPIDNNMDIWSFKWKYLSKLAHRLVDGLNSGSLSEEFVTQEIERINNDTLNGTLTV